MDFMPSWWQQYTSIRHASNAPYLLTQEHQHQATSQSIPISTQQLRKACCRVCPALGGHERGSSNAHGGCVGDRIPLRAARRKVQTLCQSKVGKFGVDSRVIVALVRKAREDIFRLQVPERDSP